VRRWTHLVPNDLKITPCFRNEIFRECHQLGVQGSLTTAPLFRAIYSILQLWPRATSSHFLPGSGYLAWGSCSLPTHSDHGPARRAMCSQKVNTRLAISFEQRRMVFYGKVLVLILLRAWVFRNIKASSTYPSFRCDSLAIHSCLLKFAFFSLSKHVPDCITHCIPLPGR
jgi:hypothetical protein